MFNEYIQIDEEVYAVLNSLEFRGLEIGILLEVREDGEEVCEEVL